MQALIIAPRSFLVAFIVAVVISNLDLGTCENLTKLGKHLRTLENEFDEYPSELDGDSYGGGGGGGCLKNYNVDYLYLTLTWGPGACASKLDCPQTVKPEFVVHGLWPQTWGRSNPAYCCTRQWFDSRLLTPIKNQLQTVWPNLAGGTAESFWSYEWGKHGRCSEKIEPISTVFKYFEFVMNTYKQLDLKKTLELAGIVPSDTKLIEGRNIVSAIQEKFGARCQLVCQPKRNANHIQTLSEIRLCLDTSLKPIACHSSRFSCLDQIIYPLTQK